MKVTILIMKIKITSPHKNTIYSNLLLNSLIYRNIVKSSTGRNGLIKQGFSDDEYPVHEGDNVSYLVDASWGWCKAVCVLLKYPLFI